MPASHVAFGQPLFGTGGAARAIAVECALAGVDEVTVANRDSDRNHELAALLNDKTPTTAHTVAWSDECHKAAGVEIVVNTTSVGLYPGVGARLPICIESLASHTVVAAAIPNPPRTRLDRAVDARGCTTLGGPGLAINQGVRGIEYGSGTAASADVMHADLESVFNDLAVDGVA